MSDAPSWLEQLEDGTLEDVTHKEVAKLVLPSGRLVACDPLIFLRGADPFAAQLKPGSYPVRVGSLEGDNAFAMLRLADRRAVRWEVARCPGEEDAEGWPGYGVDSGVGSFIDLEAARAWTEKDDEITDRIAEEVAASGVDLTDPIAYHEAVQERRETDGPDQLTQIQEALASKSSTSVVLDPESKANLVAFKSGAGDGVFASFWGYDADGLPVALVTDFGVIDPPEEDDDLDEDFEDELDELDDLGELDALLGAELGGAGGDGGGGGMSGLELLAAALGARAEPEPEVQQESPLFRQTRDLLQRWIDEEKIELEEDANPDTFAEALLEKLVSLAGYRRPGSHVAEWLLDCPEVADVFATDDEIESDLRPG